MNQTIFSSQKKLFSLISLSLMTVIVILFSNAFAQYERTETADYSPRYGHDTFFSATISVNGVAAAQKVSYLKRDQRILIDARQFLEIVGGHFFPMVQNFGLTVQYGKIISFAFVKYEQGFVACKMVDMLPPVETVDNFIMAPVNFLAQAIAGKVDYYLIQPIPIMLGPHFERREHHL